MYFPKPASQKPATSLGLTNHSRSWVAVSWEDINAGTPGYSDKNILSCLCFLLVVKCLNIPDLRAISCDFWVVHGSPAISSPLLSFYSNSLFILASPVAFVMNFSSEFSRVNKAEKCLHNLLFSNKCLLHANFIGKHLVKLFQRHQFFQFLFKKRKVCFFSF